VLVTGHHAESDEFADWPARIPLDATVVVYMPGYDYRSAAQQLLRAGLPSRTPCAIISQATLPDEQVHVTTVEELGRAPRLPAPTLLLVGEVVRLAESAVWRRQFAGQGTSALRSAPASFHTQIDLIGNGTVSLAGQEGAE
jgi:uroporphyrin-III C-methyltransferase